MEESALASLPPAGEPPADAVEEPLPVLSLPLDAYVDPWEVDNSVAASPPPAPKPPPPPDPFAYRTGNPYGCAKDAVVESQCGGSNDKHGAGCGPTGESLESFGQSSLTIAPFDNDRFIATQLEIFDNRVVVQLSNRAEQNYGHRIYAFDVLPPAEWFVSGGREHRALRTHPRSIAMTYATNNATSPGLHFVEFRFYEDVE